MMRLRRGALRAMALVLLLGLTIGVPVALRRLVGFPLPSASQIRDAWRHNSVDADLVLAIGAALFTVLWSWFVLTALAELLHIIKCRFAGPSATLRPLPHGPDRWIRQLMRFIAFSSVTATAALGTLVPGTRLVAAAGRATVLPSAATHQVVAGDCYWDIADQQLAVSLQREPTSREVLDYTNELVAINHPLLGHRDPAMLWPGESIVLDDTLVPEPAIVAPITPEVVAVAAEVEVLPADTPAPTSTTEGPSALSSYVAGLGTALLLSAGAVGMLESRRRRQWRAAVVGTRLATPTMLQAQTEKVLRAVAGPERLARLDVALRSAAADLAAQGAVILAALLGDFGEVCLFLRGSATPSDSRWQLDLHANTWRLAAETPLEDLTARARLCAQPCPAMVHLGGVANGGELFVDLEAVGVLSVVSPHSTAILRHAAATLAVSPFLETVRMFTVGVGDALLEDGGVEQVDSLDAALDAATVALGSTMTASRASSTFSLRVTGVGGEAWEPAIVIAAGPHEASELSHLATLSAPGRGLAAMVDVAVDAPGTRWQVRADGDSHIVEPIGVRLAPIGCESADVAAVNDLLGGGAVEPVAVDRVEPRRLSASMRFVEADWTLMVRVLGQVDVASRDNVAAEFERSKALELVVWLSQHRRRPTRNAARTALWDLDVRDATFANVVSDARRALARAVAPPDGEEWVARTLTEDLPLHTGVVTDAELLGARVEHARGLPALDAIDVLRPGLELVAGMPFAGTGYLWPDAEGITSSLVLLATGAAIELANHYLSLGDVDGVFWATGKGLHVLPGHEELIALRMRSQARNGDLAGVRHEWESYERALVADPWAAAEPSPKLVALRRELLTPHFAQAGG
ncbi:MAG: bacterial transcriptional activator domain-containing protein [Actinomycetia bacterium]|nr:bacterial transcriptional activator domain-containing protein [Actinomycetes bacterium]